MEINKKLSVIFLTAVSIMNLAAGIIVQIKMFTGGDINSIIPIKAELTGNEILMVNFMSVAAIIMLISVVATYLTTDIPYSPVEIVKSCPATFLIIPAVITVLGIVNAVKADITADKIAVAVCSIVYFLFCIINAGCIVTVKEDAEE